MAEPTPESMAEARELVPMISIDPLLNRPIEHECHRNIARRLDELKAWQASTGELLLDAVKQRDEAVRLLRDVSDCPPEARTFLAALDEGKTDG